MKHKDEIIDYFDGLQSMKLVVANKLYYEKFHKMSEGAFFKALERLVNQGFLIRVAKGLYIKSTEQLDKVQMEQAVLDYFFGENNDNGMYTGYRLYMKYAITDADDGKIELYSNAVNKDSINIGRIHIRRVSIELSYDKTKILEALEIFQNYSRIKDLNKHHFARYARNFALSYKDDIATYVIDNVKYKKNTIAFMKKVLDMYKIDNTLGQYLSYASKYNIPTVMKLAVN
jgi:hypothetical protein